MARTKKNRNVAPYSMKGFPAHATTSPLTETWGEWAKRKASEAKSLVEKGAEYASYVPGPIGSIASGLDAAIDSYDAYQAYKDGDMETYKKEKADAAANVVGIIPGGKLITKGAKGVKALKNVNKVVDPITDASKIGEKIVKKGTGTAIEETVNEDDVKKA
tara:strand:+ start:794 stop:1276 length:483 start_codon:yes stop_codon:yes gene_type:complete